MDLWYGTSWDKRQQIDVGKPGSPVTAPGQVWIGLNAHTRILLRTGVATIQRHSAVTVVQCDPQSLLPGDRTLCEVTFELTASALTLKVRGPSPSHRWITVDLDVKADVQARWGSNLPVPQDACQRVLAALAHPTEQYSGKNLMLGVGLATLPGPGRDEFEPAWMIYPYLSLRSGVSQRAPIYLAYLRKLEVANDSGMTAYTGSGVFWRKLPVASAHTARWYGLIDNWPRVQRASPSNPGAAPGRGLIAQDALQAWNRAALAGLFGARQVRAGTPWWFVPLIQAKSPGTPAMFVQAGPSGLDVLGAFPAAQGQPGSLDKLTLRWPWQATGLPPYASPALDGESDNLREPALVLEFDLDPQEEQHHLSLGRDVTDFRPAAGAAIRDLVSFMQPSPPRPLMELHLCGNPKSPPPTLSFVIGGLAFRLDPSRWHKAHARLSMSGVWRSSTCDVYPDVLLHLPCSVSLSGTADVQDNDTMVILDGGHTLIDRLQRPSAPIIDGTTELMQQAMLELHVKGASGQSLVAALKVTGTPVENAAGGARLIQMRPFMVAELTKVVFESQDAFTWRSDDPDGAQWRVPSQTQTLRLPPQAVGEEMERGCRFWTDTAANADGSLRLVSYIDPVRPVRYVFSPPTSITLRPVKRRRYTTLPANLLETVADSAVVSFITEPVYPLQITFKRDEKDLPDLNLAELGTFLGSPAPALPAAPAPAQGAPNLEEWRVLLRRVLVEDLVDAVPDARIADVASRYDALRLRAAIARANFHSRLAVLRLYDPGRADRGLRLDRGLTFVLRDTTLGAPAMLNPFAYGEDLTAREKTLVASFLDAHGQWGTRAAGSLAAGLLYSIEDPGELRNILQKPSSTMGTIERLSFSALGASGSLSVAFDSGLTEFTATFEFGQLMRLERRRLGRAGLMWNRARHVVVYERTTERSIQFENEQSAGFDGWPILRKTEEFVEPIEKTRRFAEESNAPHTATVPVDAGHFASERIYVNGAWRRRTGPPGNETGYEIPLWDPDADAQSYPKPSIAILAHNGSTERSRQRIAKPQNVYFYSRTAPDTDPDPDRWPSLPGLDVSRLGRVGLAVRPDQGRDGSALQSATYLAPAVGFAEPRFALEVEPDGPTNLLHGRGDDVLLAPLRVIHLGRASAQEPQAPVASTDRAAQLERMATASARLARVDAEFKAFVSRVNAVLAGISRLDCAQIQRQLHRERENCLSGLCKSWQAALREDLTALVQKQGTQANPRWQADIRQQLLVDPQILVELVPGLLERFARIRDMTDAAIDADRDGCLQRITAVMAEAFTLLARLHDNAAAITRFEEAGEALNTAAVNVLAALPGFDATLAAYLRAPGAPGAQTLLANARSQLDAIHIALAPLTDKNYRDAGSALAAVADMANAALAMAMAMAQLSDPQAIVSATAIVSACKTASGALATKLDACHTALRAFNTDVGHVAATVSAHVAQSKTLAEQAVTTAEQYAAGQAGVSAAQVKQALASTLGELEQLLWPVGETLESAAHSAWRELQGITGNALAALAAAVFDIMTGIQNEITALQLSVGNASTRIANNIEHVIKQLDTDITAIIDAATAGCANLQQQLEDVITKTRDSAQDQALALRSRWLDSEAQKLLAEIGADVTEVKDIAGTSMKLMKCVGGLPALPSMTFNIEQAEYVFLDDIRTAIGTSGLVARLHDAEGYLKELGLALPTSSIASHMMADMAQIQAIKARIGQIMDGLSGFDMRLFQFDFPHAPDGVRIAHGLDKATRTAWVAAEVNMAQSGENSLFEKFGFELRARDVHMQARAQVTVRPGFAPVSTQTGSLTADWMLVFAGEKLAVFRQTTLSMGANGSFSFDCSAERIEYHEVLKFIADFARRLQNAVPDDVTLECDPNTGRPVGVSASATMPVALPPLGAVEIAPFEIASGFGMRATPDGFSLFAKVSVGSKASPVFVQIGYLGGGMWLEARAEQVKGQLVPHVSAALAVGAMRAFNLGGIAQGGFSIHLFLEVEVDATGGQLHAGLRLEGGARILGYLDASVRLLLEVEHSGGQMKGRGTLDVRVKICWCYTARIRRQVEHDF